MSKKILKKRFFTAILAIIMVFTMMPVMQASAAGYGAGCWAYAYNTTTVYGDVGRTNAIGTIYPSEGVTVLSLHNNNTVYYIEYSTKNGPKQGYVLWNEVCVDGNYTTVGIVNTNATVYYTEDTSVAAGSVYAGEKVVILSHHVNKGVYYIEYNVNASAGRKRGYVAESAITKENVVKTLQTYWRNDTGTVQYYSDGLSQSYNVYQVPNPNIETFATIQPGDQVSIYSISNVNGLTFSFISGIDRRAGSATYGQLISGYILR